MSMTTSVGIGDLNVVKNPDVLVTYALGSCVGICLYDPFTKVAGMSHVLLPSSALCTGGTEKPMKFADTAIPLLVTRMERSGARRGMLKAKIAGGAQMFSLGSNPGVANIGQRNVDAVKEVLRGLAIPIIAEDTGKDYGRTVYFYAENGLMRVTSACKGEWQF